MHNYRARNVGARDNFSMTFMDAAGYSYPAIANWLNYGNGVAEDSYEEYLRARRIEY